MIKILFCGISGKMGKATYALCQEKPQFEIVAGVDAYSAPEIDVPIFKDFESVDIDYDVIIDFSRPSSTTDMLTNAIKNKKNVVIATTGHTKDQLKEIENASKKIAIFKASNMSLGVNLLASLVKQAACSLQDDYDIEIIEQHHNQKVDAPSGTALTLAESANDALNNKCKIVEGRSGKNCKREKHEISISSIRGGTIVGKHDVMFIGNNETITLAHEATSRSIFANGALKASAYVKEKDFGLYNMQDLLDDLMNY